MSESQSNPTSTVLENPPASTTPPEESGEAGAVEPQAATAEAVTDAPVPQTAVEPSATEIAEADAPAPAAAEAASAEVTETGADDVVHTAESGQTDPVPAPETDEALTAPVAAQIEPEPAEIVAAVTAEEAEDDENAAAETDIEKLAEAAQETAADIAQAVTGAAQAILESAREAAEKVTEATAPAVASVSESVKPVAEAVADAAADAVETVRDKAPGAAAVTEALTEAAGAVADKVQETAAAAAAAVTGEAASEKTEKSEKAEKAEEPLDPTVIMLREAKENETPVEGRVIGWNQGGFHVVIDTVTAFCPRSEMEIKNPRSPSFYVDKTFQFQVIKHQKRGRRIVLSRKALLMEDRAGKLAQIEQAVTTEQPMKGRVSSLTDFGAFVDLGGIEGLVHVTEIDHTRVNHPKDRLQMGQEVEVQVLKVENGGDRISLSMKSLQSNPWKSFSEDHARGSQFKGKVVRKTDFGLFVELQPGIDGMIHLSQLPAGRKLGDYQEGQELEGWVLRTEPGRERISLSLKEVPEGDPWEGIRDRYPEGETVEGEVEEVAPFGVFVTLEPGLTGLLPNSSLNVRRGQDASRMFPAGQKIQVQVDSIDLQRKRISLAQEGQRLAGSRNDYKAYQKRQKQEQTGGGMTAMAAAFAKLQDDRQDEA